MAGLEPVAEYAVRDEYGDLVEWSCGHPKTFGSVEELLAYCEIDAGDEIVRRMVTKTPWESVSPVLGSGVANG